jgi:hypothetical protein
VPLQIEEPPLEEGDTRPVEVPVREPSGGDLWQAAILQGDWSYDAPTTFEPDEPPARKPSRARRMMHLQIFLKQALGEHLRNIQAVLDEGVARGQVEIVQRPDGEMGYQLTSAGHKWLDEVQS